MAVYSYSGLNSSGILTEKKKNVSETSRRICKTILEVETELPLVFSIETSFN